MIKLNVQLKSHSIFEFKNCHFLLGSIERLIAQNSQLELHPEELEEIAKTRIVKREKEKHSAKIALRLLAIHLELNSKDLAFLSEDSPVIIKGLTGYFASVSHSGDGLLVSLGQAVHGVDLETFRDVSRGVMKMILSKEEFDSLGDYESCTKESLLNSHSKLPSAIQDPKSLQDSSLHPEVFLPLLYFTQKESVLKAEGLGIAGGPENVVLENVRSVLQRAFYKENPYDLLCFIHNSYVVSISVSSCSSGATEGTN